ncbi:MAG: hypothetical protein GY781_05495 [Gammaproteobacteria bacterium]|nr:hypothetical protein [Gammaproteobacteria bacterium]
MKNGIRITSVLLPLAGVLLMSQSALGANVPVSKKTQITRAITIAKQTLIKQENVAESTIKHGVIRETQWPDSSLGCAQPESEYLQVIIPGYRVQLFANGTEYMVHVGDGRGIICNAAVSKLMPGKRSIIQHKSKQNDNQLMVKAIQESKQHLSDKLQNPKSIIKLLHVQFINSAQLSSQCNNIDKNILTSDTKGYLIKLMHEDIIYNYFYNGTDVILCQSK